jgi:septum formation protein
VKVLLASASPRRKELLAALVPEFAVYAADVDESLRPGVDVREEAARLAVMKALAGSRHDPPAVVVGSDTIVADEQHAYGKPVDAADAVAMLSALRGRPHVVVTGVAVVVEGWAPVVAVSETVVELATLSDEQIAAYVASGRPLDKAGAYAIQDEDVPTVAACHGCYCGVMGLPLWKTRDLLYDFGVASPEPSERLARCLLCPERTGVIE